MIKFLSNIMTWILGGIMCPYCRVKLPFNTDDKKFWQHTDKCREEIFAREPEATPAPPPAE